MPFSFLHNQESHGKVVKLTIEGHSSVKSTDQSKAASKMATRSQPGIRHLSVSSFEGAPSPTVTAKIDYSAYLI